MVDDVFVIFFDEFLELELNTAAQMILCVCQKIFFVILLPTHYLQFVLISSRSHEILQLSDRPEPMIFISAPFYLISLNRLISVMQSEIYFHSDCSITKSVIPTKYNYNLAKLVQIRYKQQQKQ